MGASWRPSVDYTERTELVRHGLFAVIRNPIFTFIIVTAAGMALMTPNVVALAGVVGLWLGIEIHVRRVEEPYLRWARRLPRLHGDGRPLHSGHRPITGSPNVKLLRNFRGFFAVTAHSAWALAEEGRELALAYGQRK